MIFDVVARRNSVIESEDEDEDSEAEDVRNSKRIQQPNVRINPNLVKIKMEKDYNPIVAPKEEPMEENETDMKEDHNVIVEPEEEAVEQNEIPMGEEVQSQSHFLKVKM